MPEQITPALLAFADQLIAYAKDDLRKTVSLHRELQTELPKEKAVFHMMRALLMRYDAIELATKLAILMEMIIDKEDFS